MNRYIILLSGEGEPPLHVKELLPWAKKYCKVQTTDRELTSKELGYVVRKFIRTLGDK